MNRITLLLVAGFAVAFAAGGSVGMLAVPPRPVEPHTPGAEAPFGLARQLDLTGEQREQMREIWSDVSRAEHDWHRNRQALWRDRDDKIAAILTDEQRAQRDRIHAEYEQHEGDGELPKQYPHVAPVYEEVSSPRVASVRSALIWHTSSL